MFCLFPDKRSRVFKVIQGNWEVIPPLFDLERQLVEKKVGEKSSFKVLDKASHDLTADRSSMLNIP